jgi:predicted DNA-binding transcriptional regulator YafY
MGKPRKTEVDRYSPAERLIQLGLALDESRGGLTVGEMADLIGVSRRTVERLRTTLDRVTGGLIFTEGEDGRKRWRVPSGKFGAFDAPSPDELAELKLGIDRMQQQGLVREAKRLESLSLKLEKALPRRTLRRLEPDVEALLEANSVLVRPGPREIIDPGVVDTLREATLSFHQVRLTYRRRDTGGVSRPRLYPYGFLSGSRNYLVGFNPHPQVQEHRIYVLGNIDAVEVLDQVFERDPTFDLRTFATRSFGAFWDGERFDVEWRFKPQAADDARRFRFHPDQVLVDQPDGSVIVTFSASGLTEMAWHLFTWGDSVEIISPQALMLKYREWLDAGLQTEKAAPV